MLSVVYDDCHTYKHLMISVIMLNVVMLSVVYAKCRGAVVAPTNSFTAQAPKVIKAIIPPKN